MTHFEGVAPALAEALAQRGYETLTPVQEAMLDPELAGKDLLVSAQTGSGKTVAFGIAAASDLLNKDGTFGRADKPFMLVIAPTRELALQVKRELEWLYARTGVSVASCVGGMDMRDERRALSQGAHIVVGTPGRLVDHVNRGSLEMDDLRVITLDEADEMLDMGFRDELQTILDAAPLERRTLMFSATVSRSIANLAKAYQNDAVRVNTVSEKSQHIDIEYRAITVAHGDKENALINILRFYDAKNAIVFCATRAAVNRIHSRLNNRGFSVVALSGEFSQNERTHALQAMRDGRAKVCIATDVAARGIDLPDLELVIHADLPKNREGLLHRSGRTGRAGRKGISALIVGPSDRRRTERLLENAKIDATWINPPSADDVRSKDNERLLEDPLFSEPVKDADKDLAMALLERYGAEQLAAAIVNLKRADQSAPEELGEVSSRRPDRDRGDRPDRNMSADRGRDRPDRPARERKPRSDDFSGGKWFSLSVGRDQTADPKWLLPMLCKAGGLDRGDIGAIKIQPNVTFVEIAPDSADKFMKAVGPDKRLEKSITVTILDGRPEVLEDDGGAGQSRPQPRRPQARERTRDYEDRAPRKAPPRNRDSYDRDNGDGSGSRAKPAFAKGKPFAKGPRPDRPRARELDKSASKARYDDKPSERQAREDRGDRPERREWQDKPKSSKPPYKGGKPGGDGKPFDRTGKPSTFKAKGRPLRDPIKPGGASRLKSKLKRKAIEKSKS